MQCNKCGSTNTNVQIVNQVETKRKHRSLISWILFWWWVEIILWIVLTLPRLLIALFFPKKKKTINKMVKTVVCQNCGHSWFIN